MKICLSYRQSIALTGVNGYLCQCSFFESGIPCWEGFRTFRQKTFRQKHGGGRFGKKICRNVSG